MIPAATFGSAIRIYAFEPVPAIFQTLTDNIKQNGLESSYNCNNVGISETDGELLFNIDTNNSGMGHLSTTENPNGQQIRVKTVRLADFRKEHHIDHVSLVKVDVEGAEMLVLKSDETLFQSPDAPMITIEIIDEQLKRFDCSAEAVINQLRAWGYTLKYLAAGSNKLTDLHDHHESLNVHNVLAYKANHLDRIKPLL
jgi:FkbM family methyltransferase